MNPLQVSVDANTIKKVTFYGNELFLMLCPYLDKKIVIQCPDETTMSMFECFIKKAEARNG